MVQLEKRYFPLEEIAERWKVRPRDLAYMAEIDELRTSVRVHGALVEQGVLEWDQGKELRRPYERAWFTGLQDLSAEHAFLVFRNGVAEVRDFHTGIANEYIGIIHPSAPLMVRPEHLMIRRAERDRIEAKHGDAGHSVAQGLGFQHSPDYRYVRLGEMVMVLGIVQAKIVRLMHRAAETGAPWCLGKATLAEAASQRMADVFKSQPLWRTFIESDERGRYRLRLSRQ